MRLIAKVISCSLLCLSAQFIQAQGFTLYPQGQWVGSYFARQDLLLDDKNHVVEKIKAPVPPGAKLAENVAPTNPLAALSAPTSTMPIWYEGRWASGGGYAGNGRTQSLWEVFFKEKDDWTPQGKLDLGPGIGLLNLVALSETRILTITALPSRTQMSSKSWEAWTPVQVYRKSGKDSWIHEKDIDLGFSVMEKQGLRSDLYTLHLAFSDHRLVLCGPMRTFLRVIDLDRLVCTRGTWVFGSLPESWSVNYQSYSNPTILALYPMKDGQVMLCTRSRSAWNDFPKFLQASRSIVQRLDPKTFNIKDLPQIKKELAQLNEEQYKNHPELLWWEFDPATGLLQNLGLPPKGCIDFYRNPEQLRTELMNYRPHLDGSIRPIRGEGSWQPSSALSQRPKESPQTQAQAGQTSPVAAPKNRLATESQIRE